MARRLRLQYEGALYHVINRGNYRRAVFETARAAKAFETVLGEACEGFGQFSRGWAIGTHGWRKAVALEQTHLAVTAGIASDELRDIKEAAWRRALDAALQERTKTQADVERDPKKARWEIEIATRLRRQAAAPYRWIAAALNMGNHESLRVYVCHQR